MVEISPIFGRGPRMSAAAYTGRAVAPAAVEDAAESKALITKNSLQLGVVSSQIQNLTAQMQSLTGSLQVIGTQITTSRRLQEQKDNQDQELERRLSEQKLREGKESQIEKKIQAAALAPAQKIANKAQFTLGRLQDFFVAILGGWLLNQGVQTLNALSDGNKDKLNEIKNNVLKNLAIIGTIYAGIKLGLAALLGTFSVLGVKLLAVAAVGLFTKPGRQLLSFIVDAGKVVANALAEFAGFDPIFEVGDGEKEPEPEQNPDADANTTTTTDATDNVESNPETPDLKPETPKSEVETETDKGNVGQGGLSLNNATSAIESLRDSADVTARISKDLLTSMSSMGDVELDPAGPTKEAEYGQAKLTVDVGNGEVDLSKPMGSEANLSGQKVLDPETTEYIKQEQYIGKYGTLPPSMLESMNKNKTVAQNVSQPVAEPGVTVIPMQTPSNEPQTAAAPAASGPIGGVDNYATSNEDNMYTFGAMSNFNVVAV